MQRTTVALAWMTSSWAALLCGAAEPATGPSSRPAATAASLRPETREGQLHQWMACLTGENAPAIRKAACGDMLASGWPEAVTGLADLLCSNTDPAATLAVCETVAATRSPPAAFVKPLLSLVDAPDPAIREAVAAALGVYDDPAIVPALARHVKDRAAPLSRRVAAIQALAGAYDVVNAVDTLVAALDDPDPRVRSAAATALPKLAPVDFGVDPAAWRGWWKTGRAGLVNGLSQKLRQQQRRYDVLETRYIELLKTSFDKVPDDQRDARLLEWFRSPFATERQAAVQFVHERLRDAKTPSPAVGQAVRALAADPDARVRRDVMLTIRDFREPADAAFLLDCLAREHDRSVRAGILSALGRLGSPAAIPACIAAMTDPNEEVVMEAVTALGWLAQELRNSDRAGLEPAVEAVIRRFNPLPAEPALRERVIGTMSRMKDPRFAPSLRQAVGESEASPATSVLAMNGLELLGDPANIDVALERLADKDAAVREAAVKATGALGRTTEHFARLAAMLEPGREKLKTIQTTAWEACRAVFERLGTGDQLGVLKDLGAKSDPITSERFIQLFTAIESKLSTMSPPPSDLAAIRLQAASALVRINRDAEAASAVEKALPLLAGAPAAQQKEALLIMLKALLRAGQFDKAVAVTTTRPALAAPGDDAVAQVFLDHLDSLIARNRPDAAIALLDRLPSGGDSWLGAGRTGRLRDLRRSAIRLQLARDREDVRKWIADLKKGGDAATNASVMLRQLGVRAISPLKSEIPNLIAADAGDRIVEKTLVDLLKELVPEWQPYNLDGKPEDKLKALQAIPEPKQPA